MTSAPQPNPFRALGASARVHILGQSEPAAALDFRLVGRTGNTLYIESGAGLPMGSPLRIDVNGGMVLGEVEASDQVLDGYLVSIRIDQVIPSVNELSRLVERVMAESRSVGSPIERRSSRD